MGDVWSFWEQFVFFVLEILQFNLLGVFLVGVDVCGFLGNILEELCVCWIQLGVFYFFMWNYNSLFSLFQELYSFSELVQQVMRKVFILCYVFFFYFYILFYQVYVVGEIVVWFFFLEFFKDFSIWIVDYQFLWGEVLFIILVFQVGKVEVIGYFFLGIWYDLQMVLVEVFGSFLFLFVVFCELVIYSEGQWVMLLVFLDIINVYFWVGYIIFLQGFGFIIIEFCQQFMVLVVVLIKGGEV